MDYASLAKQYGGTPTVDYSSIAQKYGGTIQQSTQTPESNLPRGNALERFSVGVAKGLTSTFKGLSNLGGQIAKKTLSPFGVEFENVYSQESIKSDKERGGFLGRLLDKQNLAPEGTAEKFGFGTERIAEFLAPSSVISKAEKAATGAIKGTGVLSRGARTLTRSAIEAGANTGIVTLQGADSNQRKTTAIVSAMFPVAIAGLQEAKRGLGALGGKIQQSVIRPTARDISDGFSVENVNKYGLGGSLKSTAAKTQIKLNQLSNELNSKLKGSNAFVDLNEVYNNTLKALSGDKKTTFGDNQSIQRVLKSLKQEVQDVAGDNGLVNVYDATLIKRGAGTKGAWAWGRLDPDATATEKIYTEFYKNIKNAIEKSSPKEVAQINKQLSELIPISNAVIRRLPVDQRNNIISLTDSIGLYSAMFDPHMLALVGANRLSKSGRFGNFLSNLAKVTPSKTSIGQRVFGR